MYSLENLKRAVSEPKLVAREVNRLYHTRGRRRAGNPGGVDVFEEDWDVCLVLDACRYDYFAEVAGERLEGTLEARESVASATIEWIDTCLGDETYFDTVYVSANPKLPSAADGGETFHDCVYTWEELDASRDDSASIEPDVVADLAIEAAEEYPDKRIVGHFMQPHCPFLGPVGREEFPETPWTQHVLQPQYREDGVRDRLQRCYRENLEYVLPHVERVLDALEGKLVVTADHGQLLGERVRPVPVREVSHPVGTYVPELVEIPWYVEETGARRDHVADAPDESGADGDRDVEEMLEHLGYRA